MFKDFLIFSSEKNLSPGFYTLFSFVPDSVQTFIFNPGFAYRIVCKYWTSVS